MSLRVAGVQTALEWCNPAANFEHFDTKIEEAVAAAADLVVLPETFSTGFGFGADGFPVEDFGGPSATYLSDQAQRHGVWVAGSCPERDQSASTLPFNSFVFASPTGARYRYRKVHPFSFGGEDRHVRPGTERVSIHINGVRVTPFVCYDLRFATEFWSAALDTDLYLVVANWPAARREHWRTLLRARSIENLAYVVGINRIGVGGGLDYAGDSMVIAPDGSIVIGGGDDDTVLVADIEPATVSEVRERFGFLADRRFGIERTHRFDDADHA